MNTDVSLLRNALHLHLVLPWPIHGRLVSFLMLEDVLFLRVSLWTFFNLHMTNHHFLYIRCILLLLFLLYYEIPQLYWRENLFVRH